MAKRLAVLIDAENASAAAIGHVLTKVAGLGIANVKRVYGDFTNTNMAHWRDVSLKHAIQPIQQFRNSSGKSVTDSALIIDAMDLLHTRELEGFCIVSSDGDFTRLATRIGEDGLVVYGFGSAGKTSKPFIAACNQFIPIETLIPKKQVSAKAPANGPLAPTRSQSGQESSSGARPSR